ncbi:5217_t:CDS:2, partial [Racocetra persica]
MTEKLVKINKQLAKTLISTGLSINLISIEYVKKKRLTWERLKKELTIGPVDVEVIEYISGIDVVVYSVGVIGENERCRYIIRSGLKKAMFMISEKLKKNEIMISKVNTTNYKDLKSYGHKIDHVNKTIKK